MRRMAYSDTPNVFAGPYLDRRSDSREDANWLDVALQDDATLYLICHGTSHLVYPGAESQIAFLRADHPLVASTDRQRLLQLGWFRGTRCVLVDLEYEPVAALPGGARFEELRPMVSRLAGEDAALLAYARALTIWRARHRFCGACGTPTISRSAGHVLRCSNVQCAQELFPRLDPAIIVLVTDGERALLGRQAEWPAGRYSTLAGFVEPGESLEDAVKREVMEETGVEVRDALYRSSQPWPFPSSLMLGFNARAQRGSVIRLNGELQDARWFTPEEIREQGVMPTSHSISYRLIFDWLTERSRAAGL